MPPKDDGSCGCIIIAIIGYVIAHFILKYW
jgi:hypothetical protein